MTASSNQRHFDIEWSGDVAIIGGGIVGLAVAREILKRNPSTKLTVLEKESDIAQHQTGHNSGVIHSGIYYAPGSMKAKACVAGAAAMMRYCDEHEIPYRMCGKVIVATDESEIPRLKALYERGMANGCPNLRIIDADELQQIEPHVSGVQALLSPNTGIVDYRDVARSYAREIQEMGGEIRTDHEVVYMQSRNSSVHLDTAGGEIEARRIISCAGLYSDRVAAMTNPERDPQIIPFRGDYYLLKPERRHLVRSNIYPVPDPRFPFLGVHLTPRMDGEIWLGPNAVLAFQREGYRFRDINIPELAEMISYNGFRSFIYKHWRTGLDEMLRDVSKQRFLESLQKYVPELVMDDLVPGPSGVRAQALSADGNLVDDFVFSGDDDILHVRNAPSPAATSSLEIARMVADRFGQMN